MRYIVSMIVMMAFAGIALASDLVVKHTIINGKFSISVHYLSRAVHKAHFIVKNEKDLAIAEGETTRDGLAKLTVFAPPPLTILVKIPSGQEDKQVYNPQLP